MFKIQPRYINFTFLNGDEKSFIEDINAVFVLMPFGNNSEEKEYLYKIFIAIQETIEQNCFNGGVLKCSRSDLENGLIIMDDIATKIKTSGLTIFDISKPNLNVYFELGLACALDKNMLILINPDIQKSDDNTRKPPFDINQFRYIEYHNFEELRQKLKPAVESIVKVSKTESLELSQIYKKIQKLTRHFKLDTKAEQIKEDWNISDYEVDVACKVLDGYWDNRELEKNNFKGVQYMEIEGKIRRALSTNNWTRVKFILIHVYWNGHYKELIANMDSPAEFLSIKRDFQLIENKRCG